MNVIKDAWISNVSFKKSLVQLNMGANLDETTVSVFILNRAWKEDLWSANFSEKPVTQINSKPLPLTPCGDL